MNIDNLNFMEKALIASACMYEAIDLDPATQKIVHVLIKGEHAIVSSMYNQLTKMTTDELINNFCGPLLVNNIDCHGYTEGSFTRNRDYDFKAILKCKVSDFGSSNYRQILQFCNLCKAIATESFNTNKAYSIILDYSEGYITYKSEDSKSAYSDLCDILDDCLLDEADIDKLILEAKNIAKTL